MTSRWIKVRRREGQTGNRNKGEREEGRSEEMLCNLTVMYTQLQSRAATGALELSSREQKWTGKSVLLLCGSSNCNQGRFSHLICLLFSCWCLWSPERELTLPSSGLLLPSWETVRPAPTLCSRRDTLNPFLPSPYPALYQESVQHGVTGPRCEVRRPGFQIIPALLLVFLGL